MANEHFEQSPTRKNPLLALIVGMVFLAINHFWADRGTTALKMLTLIGALFAVLGLGGVVDPRLFYGVMPEAKEHYPAWIRAASIALAIVGLVTGVLLLVAVYGIL